VHKPYFAGKLLTTQMENTPNSYFTERGGKGGDGQPKAGEGVAGEIWGPEEVKWRRRATSAR